VLGDAGGGRRRRLLPVGHVDRGFAGSAIHVEAVGNLCKTPGTAQYVYVVTGGTGRLRHAHGCDVWQIPVADAYVSGGGWGKEILTGSLHV